MSALTLAAALINALPDPAAEIELRHRMAREAFERGRACGLSEGYVEAIADVKAAQHAIYGVLARHHEVSERRWHVCCRPCRLRGHRSGCPDCENRTSRTFSQPHPADSSGDVTARALAAWEPSGMPPAGMLHLGGPAVHHHRCERTCREYRPGWYTPAEAAGILATLPGDYASAIEELRAQAAITSGRTAA